MARDKSRTRASILDAAFVCFYRSGFTRVSVDEIAERAGITKRTLYSHFESKDSLVEAVLERHSAASIEMIERWATKADGSLTGLVDTIFTGLWRWGQTRDWRGSGFSRVAIELAELPGHPARRIAAQHKATLEQWISERLIECGAREPRMLGRQIMVLLEGTMAMMLIRGDAAYAKDALKAARGLVRLEASGSQGKKRGQV